MKQITAILFFISISIIGSTQVSYFNKKYDIRNHDDFGMSIETIDSGYVIFGAAVHSTILAQGFFLLYLDKNGDSLYTKWYGESNTLYSPCWGGGFRKYSKGGFYMGGAVEYGSGEQYGYLWLFDASGDTLWTKKYGNGNDFYAFYHARETPDKGFILAGTRGIGNNSQGLLIKTDSLGNVEWEQSYGGSGTEYGSVILPLSDGRYLMGGYTESFPCGSPTKDNMWLLKANSNGSQNSTNCYGNINYSEGNAYPAFEFANGDVAVVGAYANPSAYPYIMRVNSSGVVQYDKYVFVPNGDGFLHSAIRGPNDDILGVGMLRPPGTDYGLFMRYDAQVDSIWYKSYQYPGNSINELWDIDTAHGGGYVMCGTTNQSSVQDVWVIKVDEHGCLNDPGCWLPGAYEEEKWSVGISELEKENYFSVFPNPNNGKFFIENKVGIKSDLEIKIYNTLGEILFTTKFNTTKTEIDLTNFSNGIYFIEVRNKDGLFWNGKIIKE